MLDASTTAWLLRATETLSGHVSARSSAALRGLREQAYAVRGRRAHDDTSHQAQRPPEDDLEVGARVAAQPGDYRAGDGTCAQEAQHKVLARSRALHRLRNLPDPRLSAGALTGAGHVIQELPQHTPRGTSDLGDFFRAVLQCGGRACKAMATKAPDSVCVRERWARRGCVTRPRKPTGCGGVRERKHQLQHGADGRACPQRYRPLIHWHILQQRTKKAARGGAHEAELRVGREMLDINLFRAEKGGNPDLVRESQRRRFADVSLVDKVRTRSSRPRGIHQTLIVCVFAGHTSQVRRHSGGVERQRSASTMRTASVHVLC